MPAFTEIQASFAAAVLRPDPSPPVGMLADPSHQQRERFGVYRNNVIAGLVGQLAATFPVTRQLVGDAFFRAMARAFVMEHPPVSPVLMHYGEDFDRFIRGFPPAACLAYLGDVATLEALRVRAYHAADAEPLSRPEIARSVRVGAGPLRPHPSASLLRSRFPILTIWLANQPTAEPRSIRLEEGETVLIVRPAMSVRVHRIDTVEAELFRALEDGAASGPELADSLLADLGAIIV